MAVLRSSQAPARATPPPPAAWLQQPDADGRGAIIAIPDDRGRTTPYDLRELQHEFEGCRAFRLTKHTPDREEYYVLLANNPQDESCDCKGHLRWGRCKHIRGLRALIGGEA
jgi:hypothetical protein